MLDIQNLFRQRYFYLALALIPVAIWIAGIVAISSSPYTGLHCEYSSGNWIISRIDQNSPAWVHREQLLNSKIISIGTHKLQKNDLITTFDKLDSFFGEYGLMEKAYRDFSSNIKTDESVSLLISNKDTTTSVSIIPSAFPLHVILSRLWVNIFISLSLIILGLSVVWKKSDDIRPILYFLITLALSTIAVSTGIFNSKDIYFWFQLYVTIEWAARIAFYYFIVIFLHFCIVFPEDNFKYNKIIIIFLYIIAFVLLISFQYNVFQTINRITGLLLVLASIGITVYKYFFISSAEQKIQLRIITWGIISTMFVFIMFYIMPVVLYGYRAIDQTVMLLIGEIIPISIFFGIMRYKIMDIDTLFDNTLIYLTTLGIFALIDIAFIYILSLNHLTTLNISDLWWAVAGVWFIIFSYIPVRNTIQLWIKKLLKREIYDTDKVIIEFQKRLLIADDTDKIKGILLSTIETALHPKKLGFIMLNESNAQNGILFPLKGLNDNIGILRLEDKHSGNTYTKEDIKLIETLSNMAAVVIESIRTREQSILEKQEIAREIHDNIGHSLIMAKYMAGETNKGKELENILDNGLSDLREVLSLADGEKQTLADFIEHVYKRGEYLKGNDKIRLGIETKTEDETIELPYQVRSNLMKIIQEALSNAVKYSGGDNIKIVIEQARNELTVSIMDNGKGFDTSKDIPVKHRGLRNMAQRATMIGAKFSLTSGQGNGSKIMITTNI